VKIERKPKTGFLARIAPALGCAKRKASLVYPGGTRNAVSPRGPQVRKSPVYMGEKLF
jgi:hypothetical protein